MKDTPCGFFHTSEEASDKCDGCGHTQQAHQPLIQTSSKARVASDGGTSRLIHAKTIAEHLEPGIYVLNASMSGLYLSHADLFAMPAKVYGDVDGRANRILTTFIKRGTRPMGVMCSGKPGTGKTVLAKTTCNQAVGIGLPVIVLRQAFAGPSMDQFLEDLPTRCAIFIDEIEKIYNDEDQRNWLLSVLDGAVNSAHLWITTCNDPDIGHAFHSRPGRIRYHWRFSGLPDDVIDGIINDNIAEPEMRAEVKLAAMKINDLSPDILMSIIDEVRIHGESPKEFMEFFNVDRDEPTTFNIVGHVMYPDIDARRLHAKAKAAGIDHGDVGSFLRHFAHYGIEDAIDDYPGIGELLDTALRDVCSDFEDAPLTYDGGGAPQVRVGVSPAEYSSAKRYRSRFPLRWSSDDIESVTTEGRDIIVRHVDGTQWLRLIPAKRISRSAYDY